MSKSANKKSKGASRPRNNRAPTQQGKTEVMAGRTLFVTQTADANGVSVSRIYPTFVSDRLQVMDELYMEYRFTYLRIAAVQPRSGVNVFAAFTNTLSNAGLAPANRFEVSEMEGAEVFWFNSVTPQHVEASRKFLAGGRLANWFKTNPSAGVDDQVEFQCALVVAPLVATTGTAEFYLEYEVEYRDRVPSGYASTSRKQEVIEPRGEIVSVLPTGNNDYGELVPSESKAVCPPTRSRPDPGVVLPTTVGTRQAEASVPLGTSRNRALFRPP